MKRIHAAIAASLALLAAAPLTAQTPASADSLWAAGAQDAAAVLYAQRLAADSTDGQALHRLALLSAWGERYEESIRLFDRLVALQPGNTRAALDRARVLGWDRQFPRAIGAAEAVLEREPENREALEAHAQFTSWAGAYDRSLGSYDRLLALNPGDRGVRLQRARVLSWAQRHGEAIAAFGEMLEADPSDTEALLGQAGALAAAGRYEEASTRFRQRLEQDPGDQAALRGLARVASWSGQLRAGEARWREALAVDSTDVESLLGLSAVQRWQGNHAGALASIERAAALDPNNAEVATELSWVRAGLAPRFTPGVSYESDSDGNRILTSRFGAVLFPAPRLELRADAYVRDLGATMIPGGELSRGGSLTLATQLAGGWRASAGAGASTAFGGGYLPSYRASLLTPRGAPFTAGAHLSRAALDATAELVRNGVEITEKALESGYRGARGFTANARASRTAFTGAETNHRLLGNVELFQRVVRPLSLGVMITALSFDRDLDEGYFDPDFFGIALASARWAQELGRWNLGAELAPGVQQVGSDGDVRGALQTSGRLAYRIAPGRDIGIFAGYASHGLNLAAQSTEYRYRNFGITAGWAF
jgi:tetratricopeptide (TPR) repeat protein